MADKRHLACLFLGAFLGFTLSCAGFTDFNELHQMLTLKDFRLFLVFGGAVGLSVLGFRQMKSGCLMPARRIHPGTLVGSTLFGAGWAITGSCPAVPFAQIGQGSLAALVTLVGVVAGTMAYERLHRAWLRWDRGSCAD
ncbi:YeeE/YedE family protein [bacterium]|nr:YeeE/YedE family protein [bacterium]